MNKKNTLFIFSFLLFAVFACESPTASPANNEVWSGWKDLSGSLKGMITDGPIGQNHAITVLAYGVIDGHGRWVLAGAGPGSSSGTIYPAIVYSDNNGETWNEARYTNDGHRLGVEEIIVSLIYDGPEGDKKFVMGTYFASILWSYDGITWSKNTVFSVPYSFGYSVVPVVYGEVDREGVSTGMYVATGIQGEYAWTTDTKNWGSTNVTWNNASILTSMTHNGEPKDFSLKKGFPIRYGTGFVDGKRTGMFFTQRIAIIRTNPTPNFPQETDMFLYSPDCIWWEMLATEDIKLVPGGMYNFWLSPVDEQRLTALDFQMAPKFPGHLTTEDMKGDTLFAGDDAFSKQVDFAVVGGGYIMAVDKSRRKLAIAHEGEYTVVAE